MKRYITLLLLFSVPLWSRTYTTSFPGTENPISESGNWSSATSGAGASFGNVQTTPGLAFGVSLPTSFGDPTAILTGSWGTTQEVTATVFKGAPTGGNQEVELRFLITYGSNTVTGYEINCSVVSNYIQLVRWDGPSGSFTQLDQLTPGGCANGDVLDGTATVSGGTVTFTMKVNGSLKTFTTCGCTNPHDSGGGAFLTGAPGIGFFNDTGANWNRFGFSSVTITDGQASSTCGPTQGATISNGAMIKCF